MIVIISCGKRKLQGKAYLHNSVVSHPQKNKNHYFLINQKLKEISIHGY